MHRHGGDGVSWRSVPASLARSKQAIAAMEREATLTAVMTARASSAPRAASDMSQSENTFAALRSHPDFADVLLLDGEGALLAKVTAEPGQRRGDLLTSVAPVVIEDGGTRRRIGTVEVRFDKARIASEIRGIVLMHILHGILVAGAVVTALFFVARTVTKPLKLLRGTLVHIEGGDYTRKVDPSALSSEHTEVREVARAVERFRETALAVEEIRKSDDRAAREERRRIRAALESTQDAALVLRETGQLVFQNRAARALLGGLLVEGRAPIDAITAPEDQEAVRRAIQDRASDELSTELLTAAGGGETLPVRLRINPIYDADSVYLGAVLMATDISEQVQSAARIRHLAEHDSLTGLKNRRLLEEEISRISADGAHGEVALLLLDLDRFKQINDTLGHPVGDALLIRVAEMIEDVAAGAGLAARLGGDEFALLLRGEDATLRGRVVAREIVGMLAEPVHVANRQLRTGASIGIARLTPEGLTVADAFRRAALALYEAKRQGRGCFFEFEETMEREVRRQSLIEGAMRGALKTNAIYPMFQRQVALSTGRIVGYEALARWTHPELGQISPAEFITVAEETRQIGDLTAHLMTAACRAAVAWRARGFAGRVAVNVSPRLFRHTLPEMIDDVLLAAGCPAEALEIEITEAVLLSDTQRNLSLVSALRDRGIFVALDDFGMGYSSLSYLQSFPVDRIKIDRAFVSKLGTAPEPSALVRAIVELGHALGMQVTGEGVETPEQLEALRAVGADSVQGFVHGTPLDLEQTLVDFDAAARYPALTAERT